MQTTWDLTLIFKDDLNLKKSINMNQKILMNWQNIMGS